MKRGPCITHHGSQATAGDPIMQALSSIIQHGSPKSKDYIPNALCQYWDYRDELSSVDPDGLLFRAKRLIVPHSWRKKMLDCIHESHKGIVKCKQRAREILFWPGVSSQV